MKVVFFASPEALRKWFAKHHASATELHLGYYKKGLGKPSVTWPESVDEALAFGWIDGVRHSIDEESYTIRFTPRRPNSIWSAINIRRIEALTAEGRMRPAGLRAFESRRENRAGLYSYETRPTELDEPYAGLFRKHKAAWAFFQVQPPGYRKVIIWWVISAKREETRLNRLEKLITESARGKRVE